MIITCTNCGASRPNPACPFCRDHARDHDDHRPTSDWLARWSIVLVVITIVYFAWQFVR